VDVESLVDPINAPTANKASNGSKIPLDSAEDEAAACSTSSRTGSTVGAASEPAKLAPAMDAEMPSAASVLKDLVMLPSLVVVSSSTISQ
jgi:hypothetical protein